MKKTPDLDGPQNPINYFSSLEQLIPKDLVKSDPQISE